MARPVTPKEPLPPQVVVENDGLPMPVILWTPFGSLVLWI